MKFQSGLLEPLYSDQWFISQLRQHLGLKWKFWANSRDASRKDWCQLCPCCISGQPWPPVVLSLPFYLHRAAKTRTKQSRRARGMCSLKVNSVLWLQRRTQPSLRAPLSHHNIVEDFSSRGHELRSILARWRGDVVVIQAGKYCEALFAHALSNRYYRDYINTIIFILPLCQQA